MRPTNRPVAVYFLVALLTTLNSARGQASIVIVAPNSLANSEGNSLAGLPFDVSTSGRRYQQVFDASQFSAIGSGGGYIREIDFRLDGGCQTSGGQTVSGFQINLSTTMKGPDSLSPVFSENVGPDDTVVRGPSSLQLIGACSRATPQTFTMPIG